MQKRRSVKNKLWLMRFALGFVCMAAIACGAGCGYTTRSQVTEQFSTIYISPFVNKIDITQESYVANKFRTYRPFVDSDITRAVVERFMLEGHLRPVSEEAADLELKGELVEFRRDPLRYDRDDEVTEYRLNLVVNLKLIDRKNGNVLWEENRFTGNTTYFVSGVGIETEDQGITRALADLSRRIVERTVEAW